MNDARKLLERCWDEWGAKTGKRVVDAHLDKVIERTREASSVEGREPAPNLADVTRRAWYRQFGDCPCGDQERPGHPMGWCTLDLPRTRAEVDAALQNVPEAEKDAWRTAFRDAAPPSPAEKLSCTGWAASWCPVCGDCSCRRHPDGERVEPPLETCALHGERSTHAGSEPFDPSNPLGIPDWARD